VSRRGRRRRGSRRGSRRSRRRSRRGSGRRTSRGRRGSGRRSRAAGNADGRGDLVGRSDSGGTVVANRVDRRLRSGNRGLRSRWRGRSGAVGLARGDSDGAGSSGDLSAGSNRADGGGGVSGQLLGLVASGVSSRSDDDRGRIRRGSTANSILKGHVGLVVGLAATLADLASDILAVEVTANAGIVAGAALATRDGLEDVGLDRLRKLLDGTNDVLVALLGDGRGAVLSSDIGCHGQGRSDVGGSRGRHLGRVDRRRRRRARGVNRSRHRIDRRRRRRARGVDRSRHRIDRRRRSH
jgi:hypothetical protein